MPLILVILLVVVPLVEIAIIVEVGGWIGAGWTILLLVVDSIVGAVLLRIEGRRAWSDFRAALTTGRWPGDEVAQGALVIFGGALLLTPGFLTDLLGFLLLLGPIRRLVSGTLQERLTGGLLGGQRHRRRASQQRSRPDEHGLEVEVVEIEREQRPVEPGPDDDPLDEDPREADGGPPDPPRGWR